MLLSGSVLTFLRSAIESLQFDGDVVAIVDLSLPDEVCDPASRKVQARLKEKVTEVIVKPVPWDKLKDKSYFTVY